MNDSRPKMARREFLETCSRKIPGWAVLLSALSPADLLAREDDGYVPEDHDYLMGIDVEKCIGCGRCAYACKQENHVPVEPIFFRTWIERYAIPDDGDARVDSPNGGIDGFPKRDDDPDILRTFFVPKLCNHCANPPCVQVCPVGATFSSPDGVVLVDETYCVGCRYCIQACPYGARYLHPEKKVADKCTFCYHRIRRDLLPACVEVCPTQARVFGESGRRSSPLRRFRRFHEITVLKPWLNTQPKVLYANSDGEVI
ncbi:MAG: 4Fe-4S dicluster domain-containing protein [Candidatus Eisenbacteria bacterium]